MKPEWPASVLPAPASRAYVTYFDQRYLARALVMLRSLRHHDPAAEIFPLCFDRVAFEVIAGLADAMITPISAEEIGAFEPRLGECGERGRWEFYATHKPVLPLYVFDRRPEIGAIAHIDADTFFYASPQPLFDEIGAASLALSPHRFSPIYEKLTIYGRFNAGFIYWRRDLIGRRCLDDYRTDCLRWCKPRAEPDGRFMNQGYLTSWWRRYPSVHVIRHPGVNLAYWNIARHEITETPVLSVDGEPLIFHHFSNVHQDGRGYWHCPHRELGANLEVTLRAIYRPYLEEVEETADELRRRIPGLLAAVPPAGLETLPVVGYPQRFRRLIDRHRLPA
jgi:hypothetical protein